ncbi:energy transducer TonB [Flexistipes sp.]|uniref:energy transducer TonB n=1 Tax=Flexistipes sp. TaxID=3088135 RepID=UPI002E1D0E35|nr:TonB family protein [Flexistipes sp.]
MNSPLLILFVVLSGLFHFILAGMIVFPYSKNHQTARSIAVSFYKIDNIQNSKKTKQAKSAGIVDKERINKKSIKSEKVHKEPKTEKRTEKKIEKKTSEKAGSNRKKAEADEYKTPTNSESGKKVVVERNLSKLTFNNERKREISQRSSLKVVKNSWNDEEKSKYLQHIRKEITSRIEYPSIAKRRGLEDKVLLSFKIRKDGTLGEIEIAKESSYSILNDAVLKAVENVIVTEKPQEEIAVNIPVSFTLK